MALLEDLEFAHLFPFSPTAKRAVKELDVPLEGVGEQAKKGAEARLRAAFSGKPYLQEGLGGHRGFLESEVLSFPLARVYLSVIGNERLISGFAKSTAEAAFSALNRERDDSLKIRLAEEFGFSIDLPEEKMFSVSVADFLTAGFKGGEMKLVNQLVENGRVFLPAERLTRLLASRARVEIFSSLPLPVEGIPESVKREALSLGRGFAEKRKKRFRKITGKIKPENFPPCMEKLYSDLLAGKNLSHFARFDLTTFLREAGMPREEIIKAFSNAPNFDEKITRYQVKKITTGGRSGRGYSAASCSKIKSHALCVEDCNVKHPVQFYRNQFKKGKPHG